MKKIITILIVIILLAIGGYYYMKSPAPAGAPTGGTQATTTPQQTATTTIDTTRTVLGTSVEGREITAYHYGTGKDELLFVGGVHGGYSWNTTLVAYELMDYLNANPKEIPENIKVTVIPVFNPDGLQKILGTSSRFAKADVKVSLEESIPGRFNAHEVDLNRNFACDWKATSKWQNRDVSGGTAAFSEPEAKAFRDYVESHNPKGVVVWYSSAGGVFASNCHDGVSSETSALTKLYATASGYKAYESFDFYEITGDMVNWLASKDIPAISVLLTNHTDTEWSKNQAGIKAMFKEFAE